MKLQVTSFHNYPIRYLFWVVMGSEGPHCTRELRNIWNYERQSSSAVVSPEPFRSCLTQKHPQSH
ncbi:MADS-box transcription factor 23-like isoform X1 [Gossypium australe]|uniref:MADS-box transcription factor 23-like isoform X1 n=1 Tax=Gossypium australe TaxID=47621 RepID=A0A5B6W3F3_9ROSI|nr:MADS-box transcription factor 23-like isoform X1 [Gossypium australe]